MDLSQARTEIDRVDTQLKALLKERMEYVAAVAEYKEAHGLPVYDAAREERILEKTDPELRDIYRAIFKASRAYQEQRRKQ